MHLLILASTGTSCVSISAFTLLVFVPVGIRRSVLGIMICATTAAQVNYKEKEEA